MARCVCIEYVISNMFDAIFKKLSKRAELNKIMQRFMFFKSVFPKTKWLAVFFSLRMIRNM